MKKIFFLALLLLFLSLLSGKSPAYAMNHVKAEYTPKSIQLDTTNINIKFTNSDNNFPDPSKLEKDNLAYGVEISATDSDLTCVIAISGDVAVSAAYGRMKLGKITWDSDSEVNATLPNNDKISWSDNQCHGVGKKNIKLGLVKTSQGIKKYLELGKGVTDKVRLIFQGRLYFKDQIEVQQVGGDKPEQRYVKPIYGKTETPQTSLYGAKAGNVYVFWWDDVGNADAKNLLTGRNLLAATKPGPVSQAIDLEKPAGDLLNPPGKKLKLCMDIFLPKNAPTRSNALTCRPELSTRFEFSSSSSTKTACRVEPANPADNQAINLLIWNANPGADYQARMTTPEHSKFSKEANGKADANGTVILNLGENFPKGQYRIIGKDSNGNIDGCDKSFAISVPQPTSAFQIPPFPPTALPPTPICERLNNDKCEAVNTALGSIDVKPEKFIEKIFGILLGLSGGIALLLIIYSGYKLMLAQGNQEAIQGARETLTSAIVGLLFIIFSVVILKVIGVDILHIPGFK